MKTDSKRLTLFAGHYGSGKTNIAVNYAYKLAREGKQVCIADLDIVNPYFRTKDSEAELEALGIRLVSPQYANTNVDLPALPAEMYALTGDKSRYAVIDVGGDDRGALALGRLTPAILEEGNYESIFVANFYRPLTQTASDALDVMREIEAAGGIPFTAIVHNSNLGVETTPEDVMAKEEEARRLSEIASLPILFTAADARIACELPSAFPICLQKKIT
jgi:hypothetical protein